MNCTAWSRHLAVSSSSALILFPSCCIRTVARLAFFHQNVLPHLAFSPFRIALRSFSNRVAGFDFCFRLCVTISSRIYVVSCSCICRNVSGSRKVGGGTSTCLTSPLRYYVICLTNSVTQLRSRLDEPRHAFM